MITTKTEKNRKRDISGVEQNEYEIKNKEKGFGVGYVGYNQNNKPLALILDFNPPSLEPSRMLETVPEIKHISLKKVEFTLFG
ncbi:hypothetical protein AKJ65_01640 [candidate division MSBL1 archaeon SCGC-AAA259E19]|uniref:Uncharacterized protein n=1 Tax=candidate division MSBL1 archaeon SCGC-AAA259E19 TaxID=1698264 RepID=A0A133UMQ2_9EURY|nr:hypothetical protein AKJ65_01640 [candidate division MSBL1 archaeon SCGC-AAA259E19]